MPGMIFDRLKYVFLDCSEFAAITSLKTIYKRLNLPKLRNPLHGNVKHPSKRALKQNPVRYKNDIEVIIGQVNVLLFFS